MKEVFMASKERDNLLAKLLVKSVPGERSIYEVLEDLRYDEPLPPSWTVPLVDACFDQSRDEEQRYYFVELLRKLPDDRVKTAIGARLDMSYEALHGYRVCGDFVILEQEIEGQLPGYRSVKTVNDAVEDLISGEVRSQASADLMFQGIDEVALDWLDNPEQVPEVYAIEGKCATCSCYRPSEIGDGGVLGECDIHSAELGMFRQDATCDQWSLRDG
jgi:hypothetical protein